MCIIVGEVESISGTNIFVGGTSSPDHQFTVYSNNVSLNKPFNDSFGRPFLLPKENNVAMILPFPKGGTENGDIKIYDMSNCKDIFEKLKSYFPKPVTRGGYGGGSVIFSNSISVFQSGSYDVSIVPSLNDFERLQFDHFNLEPAAKQFLQKDYSDDFGFVVCKIRSGAEFHPIAYTHRKQKDRNYFIPTKHFHNGSEDNADWDHQIYVLGGNVAVFKQPGISSRKAIFNPSELGILPFGCSDRNDFTNISVDKTYRNNHDITVQL